MKNLIVIITLCIAVLACVSQKKHTEKYVDGLDYSKYHPDEFDTSNSFIDSTIVNFNLFLNKMGLEKNRQFFYGIAFDYCGDRYTVAFALRDICWPRCIDSCQTCPIVDKNNTLLPYSELKTFKEILESAIAEKRITKRVASQIDYYIECPK
ncbi:MAG: hypothetical protein ACO1PI_09360 [Bacteroidota bacterium]